MVEEVDFDDRSAQVQAWHAEPGITDADDVELTNSGLRRTPKKRRALAALRERCLAAGIEPLPANF